MVQWIRWLTLDYLPERPARFRLAYLPRMSDPKSDRLYCCRSSSVGLRLALFIDLPLDAGRLACTDDPDYISAVCMGHDEKPPARGHAERDEALLAEGVIRIQAGYR